MILTRGSVLCKDTRWLQWVATVATMLMMFVIGLSVGWSSPYLAQFLSGESSFPVTEAEVSWLASIYQLGRLPGAVVGAVSVQYFGSKTVMISNGCGLIVSWILVILANSAAWLYVARFICGVAIEVASVSFPLFLGDISSSAIRGALVTLAVNGLTFGILMGNVMGPYITMRIFSMLSLVPNCCSVLIFLLLPESPYYLVSKGKIGKAEKALVMYSPKVDVDFEIKSIREFVAETKSITFTDRLRDLNAPENRRSVLIVITVFLIYQFSGLNPLATYMETIMTRAMVTVIPPAMVPILANIGGILGGWVIIRWTDKLGRKIIWVFSSAGIFVSMIALGTHFYLISRDFDSGLLQWLPISSVIAFKFFVNIGVNSTALILISELFSSSIRSLAASICCTFSAVFAIISIDSYQYMLEVIDEAYIYWMIAGLMVISFVFGFVVIPEMQGKTLLEVQNVLRKK